MRQHELRTWFDPESEELCFTLIKYKDNGDVDQIEKGTLKFDLPIRPGGVMEKIEEMYLLQYEHKKRGSNS
jgi:hypothetical protein